MPGINRQSVDKLIETISNDMELGICSHMLFPVVDEHDKDSYASKASDMNMPLQIAVKELKKMYGNDIILFTDVCLCTATDHGHCGIIHDSGEIDNEMSVSELCKIALSHAEAGADYVSASDMMDGRIQAIREVFESEGFAKTGILHILLSMHHHFMVHLEMQHAQHLLLVTGQPSNGCRSGYPEAILEAVTYEGEGADIIMIKPSLTYLDG